jgi:AcrR family transcriptional regulator
MRDQADTRTRIQEIALELFTEQGYEATSLREIAERLGVTKAALYYHFKTKEDIVASLMEDRLADLRELIAWAKTLPPTLDSRREILKRYSANMQRTSQHKLMRFMERNQTALRDNAKSEQFRDTMIQMLDLLCTKDDPPAVRLRAGMAVFAMHATWFVLAAPDITDEQRQAAGLEVALDLINAPVPAPTA